MREGAAAEAHEPVVHQQFEDSEDVFEAEVVFARGLEVETSDQFADRRVPVDLDENDDVQSNLRDKMMS